MDAMMGGGDWSNNRLVDSGLGNSMSRDDDGRVKGVEVGVEVKVDVEVVVNVEVVVSHWFFGGRQKRAAAGKWHYSDGFGQCHVILYPSRDNDVQRNNGPRHDEYAKST
jgi:hypothetical protein